MTTPTTPAKATPRKRVAKPAGPPIDFSALSVVDAEVPTRTAGRSRRDNPFTQHLTESAAVKTPQPGGTWKGKGRGVIVPKANVTEVTNLIRYAANHLGMGSSIAYDSREKTPSDPIKGWTYGDTTVPVGQVRVRFCAKSRKNYTPQA